MASPTHATSNQDDPPAINFNARHKAVIRLKDSAGKLRSAGEWWTGKEVPFRKVEKNGEPCTEIALAIAGGDTKLIELVTEELY